VTLLRYILISQDISFYIVPVIIILKKLNPGYTINIININMPQISDVIIVVLQALCLFPVTSFTGQLNYRIKRRRVDLRSLINLRLQTMIKGLYYFDLA
jgi:hypothetical protein